MREPHDVLAVDRAPERRRTRRVNVGGVPIGGGAPVVVQSMTNSPTEDPQVTLAQISRLAEAGCEIVRVAVPDQRSAVSLAEITAHSPIPVVADIQFSAELAVRAIESGAAKVRINPCNIGGREMGLLGVTVPEEYGGLGAGYVTYGLVAREVERVARAAADAGIPLRVGVNSGSVAAHVRERHGGVTPEALVESALEEIRQLEDIGFGDIVVAVKASDAARTIAACRALAEATDCPQHLGVTEAGLLRTGTVKSAYALGTLLAEGIGDTLRVSLTADPVEEVRTAWDILATVGVRRRGPQIVSCPTCARCQIDMIPLAESVEKGLQGVQIPITVAVMGCIVNGPGEAREADVAICATKGGGVISHRGEVVRKVSTDELLPALFEEVRALEREWNDRRSP